MSTPTIKKRAAQGTALTKAQKVRVLQDARALVAERWTREIWHEMIDGVEHYCLYGALHRTLDLPHGYGSENNDETVSQCSLTSTMFAALPKTNRHRLRAEKLIRQETFAYPLDGRWESSLYNRILEYKTHALQEVNDTQGKAAGLRVLDRAIEGLV